MKSMKKIMLAAAVSVAALCQFAQAAPVLSFANAGSDINQSYNLGDTVSLDLWISGLDGSDASGGVDLGGFDMNLSFNGAVTGFDNAVFSSDLDDSLFYGLAATPTSSNSLNLFGLSLLDDLSQQGSALKLFTLSFKANQVGTSLIKIDDALLVNAGFADFAAANFGAEIKVGQAPVSAPEPGSAALLLCALAGLLVRRAR